MSELMTSKEATEYLSLKHNILTVWRHQKVGPPYLKMGPGKKGSVRYSRAALDEWLKTRTVAPESCVEADHA